jgi:hypothetical protein
LAGPGVLPWAAAPSPPDTSCPGCGRIVRPGYRHSWGYHLFELLLGLGAEVVGSKYARS